jgi:hypothetical protein
MSAVIKKQVVTETGPRLATARHWIGGEWVDSDQHGDSINPATGPEVEALYRRGRAWLAGAQFNGSFSEIGIGTTTPPAGG